jgi:hypothetical protein
MKKMYIVAIDSIFIFAMLAGCSPTASPAGNVGLPSSIQNYQVEIINLTEPVYETIRTESIDQPNCNGTGDVDNVVERTMGINHSIELGLGLTVDIDGKLELFGTGVDLGAAISSELGYQYGITESISRSITVRAAPKSHVVHTVKLSEVWESGTARVISNGESIDIPFRFRANFSIDLLESVPVTCPTGQAGQTVTDQPTIQSTPVTSTSVNYDGWVICWHGRDGYEYLIAYPENDVKQGISLNYQLTNAQGRQLELANDSLKMCYVDGEWYGYPDPNPWFPSVSYMQLLDREILVCSDSPGCQGNQSKLFPEKYFPWNAPELQAPNGTGVHVIAYKDS